MKKLGMATFESENGDWHFETESKSDQELTDEMSNYLSDISKDFPPVNSSLLGLVPPKADFVSEVECSPTEEEIFSVLQAAKKT